MCGKREGYTLTNAMKSCALTLNGQSISYKPSLFINELAYLNVCKSQFGRLCEPFDSDFYQAVTTNTNINPIPVQPAAAIPAGFGSMVRTNIITGGYDQRMAEFNDLVRVTSNAAVSVANRGKVIEFFEPVFMPICNFFGDVAYDMLPSWSPYRGFSQAIPHVNNCTLEFQFFSYKLFSYLMECCGIGGTVGGAGCNMKLVGKPTLYVKWFKVSGSIASIPRVVTLQSVYVDRHPL